MSDRRQEFFNLAVIGLSNQSWKKSVNTRGGCVYVSDSGNRCAWGHVDKSLSEQTFGSISLLREMGVGIATKLSHEEFEFAKQLQGCHDLSFEPADMNFRFRDLGKEFELKWPEGVP